MNNLNFSPASAKCSVICLNSVKCPRNYDKLSSESVQNTSMLIFVDVFECSIRKTMTSCCYVFNLERLTQRHKNVHNMNTSKIHKHIKIKHRSVIFMQTSVLIQPRPSFLKFLGKKGTKWQCQGVYSSVLNFLVSIQKAWPRLDLSFSGLRLVFDGGVAYLVEL